MSDIEPVAWAVNYGLDPDPEVYWHYPRHAAESGRMVVPLYRQPTLTDAEREAIREACDEGRWYPKDYSHIDTLRGLLERTR